MVVIFSVIPYVLIFTKGSELLDYFTENDTFYSQDTSFRVLLLVALTVGLLLAEIVKGKFKENK